MDSERLNRGRAPILIRRFGGSSPGAPVTGAPVTWHFITSLRGGLPRLAGASRRHRTAVWGDSTPP